MKALVGLGNPGAGYEFTRHNVGFLSLDEVASALQITSFRRQCKGLVAEGRLKGERVILLKPQTYMNLSGESVLALLQWYKMPPQDVMVLSDDIDLPQGALRIRQRGGAGTHNGWRSILAATSSQDFPRARIGIGAPPPGWELSDWVLSRFDKAEQADAVFAAIHLAAKAGLGFLEHGIQWTMNQFNIKSRNKSELIQEECDEG